MLVNLIKNALRFLLKNKLFSFINLIGLAIGFAAFLIIVLFLQEEFGYERHIPEGDRIFRMVAIHEPAGLERQYVALTSGAWADLALAEYPEVQAAFRLAPMQNKTIKVGDEFFSEPYIYRSESALLEWFNFPVVSGSDPADMLSEPNLAVLSKKAALKFFGNEDAVGNTIVANDQAYLITGIIDTEDILAHQTINILLSLVTDIPGMPHFQMLANNWLTTYFVLRPDAFAAQVEEKMNTHYSAWEKETYGDRGLNSVFYLQPLKDIHLRSNHLKFQLADRLGNINNVSVLLLIAILVIIIACINYINLATAYSLLRRKDAGLRKVLGATPAKLRLQFLGETFLLTFAAILLALFITELLIPRFNALFDSQLKIDFSGNPVFNIGLLALLLLVGFIAGLYPSFVLSQSKPVDALKSANSAKGIGAVSLRKVLVVFQFAISTAIIFSTFVILQQVNSMRKRELGYEEQKLIHLNLGRSVEAGRLKDLKSALLSLPEIKNVGAAVSHSGITGRQSIITAAEPGEPHIVVRYGFADPDFFPAMEIKFSGGRNFDYSHGTDPYKSVIINEATAKAFGWDEPIGKRFLNCDYSQLDFEHHNVVGVVSDFHYHSLHLPIDPTVFIYDPGRMSTLNIRLNSNAENDAFLKIREIYNSFFPDTFFDARLVEDITGKYYQDDQRLMVLFYWFAILCIVISCMGLFGLTLFVIGRMRKEIVVRRLLGSTIWQIILILLRPFMIWIILSSVLAFPPAYVLVSTWLNSFSYHISIQWFHFLVPFILVLLMAALTIVPLALKAACENPAEALAYE